MAVGAEMKIGFKENWLQSAIAENIELVSVYGFMCNFSANLAAS